MQERVSITTASAQVQGPSSLYRQFVRVIRYILALLILSIITVMVLWPDLNAPEPPANTDTQTPSNELVNPKFEAVDSEGHPYELSANRAKQDDSDPDFVHLSAPSARIVLDQDQPLTLRADRGGLKQETGKLTLTDNVELRFNDQYTLKFTQMMMDLKGKTVTSSAPVSGTLPNGSITATGVDGTYDEGTVIFKGPAKLILENTDMKGPFIP